MGEVQKSTLDKELAKQPDISADDIRKLREWLKTQPHLPGDQLSDEILMLVYYCCEKSSEVSKQVLDLHYTLRTLFNNYFKDRSVDDPRVQLCLDIILYAPLPNATPDGTRVFYGRLVDPDTKKFYFNDVAKTFMMIFDLWQYEEGTWPGFILMIDMDKATLGHITRLEISTLREILYFLQECMLVKLKSVHFLNAPAFMDKLMILMKPFIKKELLDTLFIHQPNAPKLYEFVSKSAFPKEEGGDYKDHKTLQAEMKQRLSNNKRFFEEENKCRVNEALRPGGKTKLSEQFGTEGSFKKLDFD